MARTSDPDSATSQFYINLRMNFGLDYRAGEPGYTVFGIVTDGQHVVREISLVPTEATDDHEAVPLEPVLIERVELLP
jgi:peptidyl-prolyl cis-trans isomerase A (cyclophilin A)/peptidyl-prolyl cis-trans isomerase B (cyclophilin B)